MRQLLVTEDWTSHSYLLNYDESTDLYDQVSTLTTLPPSLFRLSTTDSKDLRSPHVNLTQLNSIRLSLSLPGGKGGFGSLLRSMNPKKNLADNYDSCRDLSGRRLRTVQNEQRMEEWKKRQEEEEKFVSEEVKLYEQQKKEL